MVDCFTPRFGDDIESLYGNILEFFKVFADSKAAWYGSNAAILFVSVAAIGRRVLHLRKESKSLNGGTTTFHFFVSTALIFFLASAAGRIGHQGIEKCCYANYIT